MYFRVGEVSANCELAAHSPMRYFMIPLGIRGCMSGLVQQGSRVRRA